ncbi:regulator of protease activity HflC (stomatin/prohibitin superfamily) [Aquimarina sp. EL_43]|uniref:SPFH domain-containing protein n=1 Tax=Aquimarina TaxID=290174 RepID=UPI00047003F3|nr:MULTISPECIES: SPFH domain-containing protein [Aquimarina]MBG6130980.1 regulator of protease activity HflC (stomatin/prohibitin superfamily) [Aquimarina sp. EL_35]MBG6151439.1 regulator of protease activity HflC (stomatin/prohibitin superfamily) [Aquimarina sp. EL_32]MBG6169370.1 regulator of protease activity HflC (stomatin/prohibitin superfamily) [Aquimarina sp. EL_43]
MLTFIGIVMILTGIIMLIIKPLFSNSKIINWFTKSRNFKLIGFGFVLSVISGMFFYAEPGTAYAVQYPWGTQKAVVHQGINTKMWGRLIPIQFELPIKYVIPNKDSGELGEQSKYANVDVAKYWAFSDAVKARIATSVVISINTTDESQFLSVADRNKTEKNLIRSRIIPNIDQSIKNTCKLMDAQDYISGQASDFDRYFKDQLENGMYVLEEYIANENRELIGDSSVVRTIVNKESKQKRFKIKYVNGEPVREKGNSLKAYGLTVVQAVVTEIDWESTFDKRLQLQKEEVAQTQLEKQQAEREFYRAQKETAKGEAEKATERARLEKEQIQKTIEAETKAKVAEFNLIEERKNYEVAQFKAKTQKTMADAQSYENAKLVSAGLTPQERAEWEYKTSVNIARELKELKLPEIYIQDGGKQDANGNLLQSLIGADLAKKMMTRKSQ